MAASIFMLVISLGAIAAGWGYVKTARRMRSFQTTRGRIVGRELATVGGDTREGLWGKGGGYRPKVTYTYTVGGRSYTSDRSTYAHHGFKKRLAEERLAAIPDEVDVHYDPASPDVAYLERHTPRLGYGLLALGIVFALIAIVSLLPA